MARKRRRNENRAGELNLTAMIDVAFQLLSFFIITVHPVDVFAHLSVFRPSPEQVQAPSSPSARLLRVTVFPDYFAINDKPVSFSQLEDFLGKMASYDPSQTVLIMCTNESPHERLVALLDLCTKVGLTNLSVVSSGGY